MIFILFGKINQIIELDTAGKDCPKLVNFINPRAIRDLENIIILSKVSEKDYQDKAYIPQNQKYQKM